MTIHITRASQQAKLYIICNVHACVLHAKAQTSLLCSLAKLNLRRVKVWLRKTVRGQCVHERHAGDSASLLSPTKLARTTGCSAIQRAGRRKLPHLPPPSIIRALHIALLADELHPFQQLHHAVENLFIFTQLGLIHYHTRLIHFLDNNIIISSSFPKLSV